MTHRSHLPAFVLSFAALLGAAACGMQTANDVYLEGLRVEGDAERNVCRLVFDEAAHAHVLDSGKVLDCLERNREALALYEKAADMGQTGLDFRYKLEDARSRVEKLEEMYRMVKLMEKDHTLEEVHAPH